MEGSGRASDAMASFIKHQDDFKYPYLFLFLSLPRFSPPSRLPRLYLAPASPLPRPCLAPVSPLPRPSLAPPSPLSCRFDLLKIQFARMGSISKWIQAGTASEIQRRCSRGIPNLFQSVSAFKLLSFSFLLLFRLFFVL